MRQKISYVVPVCNEEESLSAFYTELLEYIPALSKTYEIVFIDDGSSDQSLTVLKGLAEKDNQIKIFAFRRNHGKAEALTLGFQMASGDTVVTLDADLQDRPDQIKKLLEKLDEYEMVSGWRKDRKDSKAKIIASRLFNYFSGSFWGLTLHDYNCGLKAYTKDAAKSLQLYGGMHRFIPLIAYQQGFTVSEVAIRHDARKYGKSKYGYGFLKLFRNLPDMLTMLFLIKYSKRPLHFFAPLGFLFSFVGIVLLTYFGFIHTVYRQSVGGRPLLFIAMLLVITGLQILFTGLLADLIIHGHNELRDKNYASQLSFTNDKNI